MRNTPTSFLHCSKVPVGMFMIVFFIHEGCIFTLHYCCLQVSFFSLGFERPDLSVCRFVGGMKVGSSRNSCCCMGRVWPVSPASEGGCDCSAIVSKAAFWELHLLFTVPVCPSRSLSVLCLLAWKVGSSSSAMFLMCWLCLRRQRQQSALGGSEKL